MLEVAIVGGGPFGLSIAAYFQHRGIAFRIFGHPMDSWITRMPKGMLLKSEGFASNIYDPDQTFTLKQFCAGKGIPYADTGVAVRLDTFAAYGLAFQERMVPAFEPKLVTSVERVPEGYRLRLDDGETLTARRVVVAAGITHFAHVPESLAHLPATVLSHSSRHSEIEAFRGRKIVVIGGGSSAMDMSALLHGIGADVQMVSRRHELKFPPKPTGKRRSAWQRMRHPDSGLGAGLRRRFLADAPGAFHHLPERTRVWAVKRALGPSGGWFSRDMVMGSKPPLLGHTPHKVEIAGNSVRLHLRTSNGAGRMMEAEHLIAATGYRVQVDRLQFLNPTLRRTLKTVQGAPVLSRDFESSSEGLYFAGVAAANSFGPVMRFAFGAGFTAERLTAAIAR